jgi:uncharacterized protein YpmS
MNESRPKVVIPMHMGVFLIMLVGVTVMVVVIVPQKVCAQQIYAKPDYGNWNSLIESNRHRIEQTIHTFIADEQRNYRQSYRARKRCEVTELTCAER